MPFDKELAQYGTVFLLLLFAALTVAAMLLVARLLAPSKPTPEKQMAYECGERPLGSTWLRFNIRFYVIALVFLLFDVELALVYPIAEMFRVAAGAGGFRTAATVFAELFFFVGVLALGLLYLWRQGDLAWIRSYRASTERGLRSWRQAAPPGPPADGRSGGPPTAE